MALNFDCEGSWDPRSLQLISESIALGMLPKFSISKKSFEMVDLRLIPPQTSELYLIHLLSSICDFMLDGYKQKKLCTTIILIVLPFNPNAVLTLSGRITPIPEK